jgi:hypothetical protein
MPGDQPEFLDERFDEMFDFAVPPAPVDVHDFARHAGEIIARAALGKSKRKRDASISGYRGRSKHRGGGPDNS